MMPNRQSSDDDAMFDRLVDGELSADERRTLLQSLEARSDGWRRCACAFLEAQSWGREFRQLLQRPGVSKPEQLPANRPIGTRAAKPKSLRRAMSWAAIAACVVVAFSLGRIQPNGETPPGNVPLASAPVMVGESDDPQTDGANDPNALTLWVRNENGRVQPVRVPLMDADAVDRELGVQFRPGIPASVRSHLEDRGYQVESKRRYAPLWLENGQRMVLPVEDTKIVPVSQNVY
jgi:hypothetical protein